MIDQLIKQSSPTAISDWLNDNDINSFPKNKSKWNLLIEFLLNRIKFHSDDLRWLYWIKVCHDTIQQTRQLHIFSPIEISEKMLSFSTLLILCHPITPATYRWINPQQRVHEFFSLFKHLPRELKQWDLSIQKMLNTKKRKLAPHWRVRYEQVQMVQQFLYFISYLLPLIPDQSPLKNQLSEWYHYFPSYNLFQQLQIKHNFSLHSPKEFITWFHSSQDQLLQLEIESWNLLLTRIRIQIFLSCHFSSLEWTKIYFSLLDQGAEYQQAFKWSFLDKKIDMIRYLQISSHHGDQFYVDFLVNEFCQLYPFSADEAKRRSITIENLYQEIEYKLFQNEKWSKEYHLLNNLQLLLRKLFSLKQWLTPRSHAYHTLQRWLLKFPHLDETRSTH
ncbi:hypothetical protein SAMN05444392_104124 [Seinonella peptonophila]|uniref:Uncharacterized protein n=1 Tax=Seinonella peptonophila TaxID=112248 RepID=A0A1M4X5M1_9BACL|nr:hypothetical protein [Seinonella peptonophila]SHE88492.1 hypothetical protein SAMN05444392_104124 [Seinonella peptonophila]